MSESARPYRDVAGVPKGPLDAAAWDERWRSGETGWDLGEPAPALVTAVADGWIAAPGRALVPGCGRGHDARFLARSGFDVVGLDVAPSAVSIARVLARAESVALDVQLVDFLVPTRDLGTFDVLFEHTCFCAIDPSRRDDYVAAAARALRPGGALLGVFFLIEPEEGPPFGATEDEIRHRFAPHFDVERTERPSNSVERRQGIELLALLRRRA